MESLTHQLPDLSMYLTIPDLKHVMEVFDVKNLLGGNDICKKDKEGSSMKIDDSTKTQITPRPSLTDR